MSSAHSVTSPRGECKVRSGAGIARRATVQPVWGDTLGRFVAAVLRVRPIRVCLVSPWITETDRGRVGDLVRHMRRSGAQLVVVTRPATLRAGEPVTELIERLPSHQLLVNDQLHAKLYVCQEREGRGVALIGSANLTAGGARLSEVGLLVRPLAGSDIIDELARVAVAQLGGRPVLNVRRPA